VPGDAVADVLVECSDVLAGEEPLLVEQREAAFSRASSIDAR